MISIVIPNYNGLDYLKALLPTIEAREELFVVDNGSSDGSVDWLESRGVRVLRLKENRGFAAACNEGARRTSGEAIFFLNSDTLLDRRCLTALAVAMNVHKQCGFFAPKMVMLENRGILDGAGDFIPADGRPAKRGEGLSSATPFDAEIISPCGGAALWRRELFESLGGFDEDFFAYLEDVDLGLRARFTGASGMYISDAVVYHLGAGTQRKAQSGQAAYDSADIVRYVARNKIWLWAKCLPTPILIKYAPAMAAGLIKSAAHHTFRSGEGAAFFSGTIAGLIGLPKMLRKRTTVQSARKVMLREVERWIKSASRS